MLSAGAQQILIGGGVISGSIHFDSMQTAPALGHRLKLQLRISLDQSSELGPYALTDIAGELSFAAVPIGRLHWHGPHPDIPSKPRAADCHLALVLDIDPWILDRIEAQRAGNEPSFTVDLWPYLEREDGRRVRAWIDTFSIPVSRDAWLRILDQLGYGRYDLIEIRLPVEHAEDMRAAIDFLRKAQANLQKGFWFESLQEIRFVCEALEHLVKPADIKDVLKSQLDNHRGGDWAGIFSRLKGLSALSHHFVGQNARVGRAEARGAVRLATSLVEIISTLRA